MDITNITVGHIKGDHHLPFDIIYELCKWNLNIYRALIYNRQFHEYMSVGSRLFVLQNVSVKCTDGVYTLDGRLHRIGGPAITHGKMNEEWYRYGVLHRIDGPAQIFPDGSQWWYLHGRQHREDGPAVIYSSGSLEWWFRGRPHRIGGPAMIDADTGSVKWYNYGLRHRVGGPAVITSNGTQKWYYEGKLHRSSSPLGGAGAAENGEELPAVISPDGTLRWYHHGEAYRVRNILSLQNNQPAKLANTCVVM